MTGTLATPEGGWTAMSLTYLTATVLGGALTVNIWEAVAWQDSSRRE